MQMPRMSTKAQDFDKLKGNVDLVLNTGLSTYPFPRWRPQLGAKPMNISIRAKLSVEREPVIGQTLIDMRGRKPAWEGIL
jgi:hypothetical protein